jgi:hypothetical protein
MRITTAADARIVRLKKYWLLQGNLKREDGQYGTRTKNEPEPFAEICNCAAGRDADA